MTFTARSNTLTIVTSRLYDLADRSIDGRLRRELAEMRDDGLSFREIADQLRVAHSLDVSHETVRRWCIDLGIENES